MNTSRIAAVVVTYNRKALLAECLSALQQQEGASCDILVVNNASTDGTEAMLAAQFPDVQVLTLEKNSGGAGGFCAGMKQAVEAGYDRIWIMDDDTIPTPGALAALVQTDQQLTEAACLEHPEFDPDKDAAFGFLSSTVEWSDGSLCKMNRQTLKKGAAEINKGTAEANKGAAETNKGAAETGNSLLPIAAATFVSLYFPAAVVRKMGLPIADYFIWGDDKEYTLRLSDRYPCWWDKSSTVLHKTANNEGSSIFADDASRVDRYFYAYRNDLTTAKRRGIADVCIYLAGFALNFLRVILYGSPQKGKRLSVMLKGFFAGITFAPKISFVEH